MDIKLEYNLTKSILINNNTFNPSIMFQLEDGTYDNKIILNDSCNFILSYRSSQSQFSSSKIYIKTGNMIEYDKLNNKIKLHFSEDNKSFGSKNEILEDSRFTILKKKLHLVYSHFKNGVKQIVSPYNDENIKIQLLQGIPLRTFDKNWVIFNKKNSNNTIIIYQFYPEYLVYEVNEDNVLTKIKSKGYPFTQIIRGGTSPIEIDNKLYLFGHSFDNGYRLSLVLLDVNTLDVISYCNNVLEENTDNHKIIFCRGSVYIENLKTFIISVGINDINIEFIKLDLDYINNKLIQLH